MATEEFAVVSEDDILGKIISESSEPVGGVRRQAFFPVVLPHSAMLPNKVCCDPSLFHCSSGDEVWRRGRHLSPLLQHLCRSCETVLVSPRCFVRLLARGNGSGLCGDAAMQGMTWRAHQADAQQRGSSPPRW